MMVNSSNETPISQNLKPLTLPLPSLLVPTPYTKGGGGGGRPDSSAISKAVTPMNVKFCRELETSLNVLKMLKLFTQCLLCYHSNSLKGMYFVRKIARFQTKIPIIQIATKFTILKITFQRIALLLLISEI